MPEIPEPGDRALVMWTSGGIPTCAYIRIDEYASNDKPLHRWFDTCEDCATEQDPLQWAALLRQNGDGWHGPFSVNVGELLGGTE